MVFGFKLALFLTILSTSIVAGQFYPTYTSSYFRSPYASRYGGGGYYGRNPYYSQNYFGSQNFPGRYYNNFNGWNPSFGGYNGFSGGGGYLNGFQQGYPYSGGSFYNYKK